MRAKLPILLFAAAVLVSSAAADADKLTVCTITVNSADEKESFRRHLPASEYRFVELVERGRPDWLASACRAGTKCDALIISGHYDGGTVFYSDRLDRDEFLPVAELERVSCSDSCPGLFSGLKEVYLFGCNTLNPVPRSSASAELVRTLVRQGQSRADADRLVRSLNEWHGQSSRDQIRLIFQDVPVIYGFASAAPLGPAAAERLDRYFEAQDHLEVGDGRVSLSLLAHFVPQSLTLAEGVTADEPLARMRKDVCRFVDDRPSDAQRLEFVHQVLRREPAQARVYLDRLQAYVATLDGPARQQPGVAAALEAIARDEPAKQRFLDFARHDDEPSARARMIDLARDLGWLSASQRRTELARMLSQVLAGDVVDADEVDLACTLNEQHELDGALDPIDAPARRDGDDVAHAAMRACLGSVAGRARALQALFGGSEADARIADAYLRHRPIDDPDELRRVATGIVGMGNPEAQALALETLGRQYLTDGDVLASLTRLYGRTRSWEVQAAIAGVLIRADDTWLAGADLERRLLEERLPSPSGANMIDALVHRLQSRRAAGGAR